MTREGTRGAGADRPLERRVALGLSISLLIVVGVAVGTYRIERLARQSADRTNHANEVGDVVDATSAQLDEVDAAKRGYVVTGDPLLLATYRAAAAKLSPKLAEFRKAIANNPRQTGTTAVLQTLFNQKHAFSEQVIEERRTRGFEYAAALMATNKGEALKIKIREILHGVLADNNRLLLDETQVMRRLSSLKLAVLGVGIAVQLGFLIAVFYLVRQALAERRAGAAALADRVRLATFAADVGAALTESESLPRALEASAEAMVRHLGASVASIWVVSSKEPVLECRATAGGGNLPDSLERIPIGQLQIGRIAAQGQPEIADLTRQGAGQADADWARGRGMVSLAGHPLVVAGRSLGVMAVFSLEPITDPVFRAMGTVSGTIALAIDRARAAESLQASETLTRSIVEGLLDGLVTVDATSRITSFNQAAEQMFGYSRAELIGKPLSCIVPETEGATAEQFLQMSRERLIGGVTEAHGRRKDGTTFLYELALFEFWTSEGRHFGGAMRDVTERQEVDRLKREFVSTVSHELRTPLTSIRGALGLVAGGAAGLLPDQAKALLDIALKNSERLARLVNDILDMEKIEAGQLEFKMEELRVAPLLEGAVEANRSYAEQFGVGLAVEDDAPGARVRTDPDRLIQVLTNLLSNAVKFSPKGETVRLIASRHEGIVRFEIKDRGPGIPEEFRSRIFGRFQQADSSDTRQKGGTGLGLAITRLIAEKLGGTVGFDTEIGRGSTFWVELPLVGVPAHRPRILQVEAGRPLRPRVLHVDDDPDLPAIVAAALSEFADVDIAHGVREAKQRLTGTTYDVVVLDVGLPDGSGLELQPLLVRPTGVSTPFVFFTAHEISREAAGAAADVLIKARSTVAELVGSVRSLIAASNVEEGIAAAPPRNLLEVGA
jgi:PAS domain S-box-containing protein